MKENEELAAVLRDLEPTDTDWEPPCPLPPPDTVFPFGMTYAEWLEIETEEVE